VCARGFAGGEARRTTLSQVNEFRQNRRAVGTACHTTAYGGSIYLDVLEGFCLLGFRGTTARDTMTRSVGFLPGSFCVRFAFGSGMSL